MLIARSPTPPRRSVGLFLLSSKMNALARTKGDNASEKGVRDIVDILHSLRERGVIGSELFHLLT